MKMIILLFTLMASLNFTHAPYTLPRGCHVTIGLEGAIALAGTDRIEGANHQVTWGVLQGDGTPTWMRRRDVEHHLTSNVYVMVPIGTTHAQRLTTSAQPLEGEYVVEKSCVYIRGAYTHLKADLLPTNPGGLGYDKEVVYVRLSDNSILGGVLKYAGEEQHPDWVVTQ